MAELRRFTKTNCDAAKVLNGGAQTMYWETSTPGFGLCVGRKAKTFVVQRDVNGKSQRASLGRYPALSIEDAREQAQGKIKDMRVDPHAHGFTLRDAMQLYLETPKRRGGGAKSARSVQDCKYLLDEYLGDWMDRPLQGFTRTEVRQRHAKIAADIAARAYRPLEDEARNGASVADHAMRYFRAIWNRAMLEHPTLPVSPTISVNWRGYVPRSDPIDYDQLPTWWKGIKASDNAVRRDANIAAILTGLRPEDVARLRWANVDFARATLRITAEGTKSRREFEAPIGKRLLALLRQRKKEHDANLRKMDSPMDREQRSKMQPFVFAAWSDSGHIVEMREPIDGVEMRVYSLRHTFRQVGEHKAGISEAVVGALMDHTQHRKTITQAYGKLTLEHELRPAMQRIEDAMYGLFAKKPQKKRGKPLLPNA
jgi:integrase